ncbi:MAG TPA: NADH-quinone oxidoreductase subunit F, partial [Syntrophomonas wolfei]|nr:NADH-quinone oxidoreductase subunit F [Syntrophomonas wolfei]
MTTMNKSLIHLLLVCCGTGCVANGAREVYQALKDNLTSDDKAVLAATTSARATGCHGLCAQGPFVRILPEDITYCRVKAADIPEIVEKTLKQGEVVKRLLFRDRQKKALVQGQNDIPFYRRQTRVALRNVGLIDPSSLQDYLERGGYRALEKSLLDMRPEQVIEEIIKSGLRGRGGGGFPAGLKWKACAATPAQPRYIICNGDEG